MSVFQHAPQSGAADAQALGRAGLVIAVLFQHDLYDLPVDLAQGEDSDHVSFYMQGCVFTHHLFFHSEKLPATVWNN